MNPRGLLGFLLTGSLALASASLVPGGSHRILPENVYFVYTEEALACGAIFDPLPAPSGTVPLAEVTLNRAAGWSCANPRPYPGPDEVHPEVVVLGNESADGRGRTVYYLVTVLELYDARWVTNAEARRIRADPERALRVEIHKQLQNMALRYQVSQRGTAHVELSQHLYAPRSPDEDRLSLSVSALSWQRIEPSSVELSFQGYPWLLSHTSRLTPFFFGYLWQWRAEAAWVAVLRGRAHGNEPPARARITLSLDDRSLVQQSRARTRSLSAEGGRLPRKIPPELMKRLRDEAARLPLEETKSAPAPFLRLY